MQAAPARPPATNTAGRRLSLVLGVILAFVAFLGVAGLGLYVTQSNNAGSVTVYVANQDIPVRTTITADMLKSQSIPTTALQPNQVTKTSQAVGKAAAINIAAGQQITTNELFAGNNLETLAASAYLPIPKGWVARAITTGEVQGVGGYVQAGDYINVIVSVNQSLFNTPGHQTNKNANVSKTTFTDIRVIEIGPSVSGKAANQTSGGVTSSLIVILTQCDAEYFDWFLNNTKVTYSVLSYKDYGSPPSQPVASCPPTTSTGVGPDQVDARYHFTAV